MTRESWVRWAERVYGAFGVLLPRSFRDGWWSDARELFRDRARSVVAARGLRALPAVLVRGLADVLIQSVVLRREARAERATAGSSGAIARRAALLWDELRADVRHGVRALVRTPGFAVAALATLAAGVGVNAAMFGVVNGVLLRPLPYADADELVMVWERNLERGWPRFTVSPANWLDWRTRANAFVGMAAYSAGTATLLSGGDPERVRVLAADASLFEVLRVRPVRGSAYSADAQVVGRNDVVLLSHRLWAGRFGADPELIGATIRVDGRAVRVIGVLPRDLAFQAEADLWQPLVFPFDVSSARGAHYLSVLARLAPDASVSEAQAQMNVIAASLAESHAETNAGWTAVVVPLREQMVGGVEQALLVLWGAVGFVMLIACANVVNLLLARGTARREEYGVRATLGAAPGRLARQLIVESLVLAVAGTGAGVVLAFGLVRLIVVMNAGALPRADDVSVDVRVLSYCAGLAALVGVVVGAIAAAQASRVNAASHVAAGGKRTVGGRTGVRRALLVGEIAVALVLLTGFGLVARSLLALLAVPPGFTATGLVAARLSPPAERYPEPADRAAFYDAVLERVRAAPVVEAASVTTQLPLTGSLSFGFEIDDGEVPPAAEWPSGQLRAIEPAYFETMHIRVVRGRAFRPTDAAGAPPVIIVNETLARRYLPDRDAIGARLLVSSADAPCPCEIVGVVADVRELGLDAPPAPVYYLLQAQSVWTTRSLVVRSDAPLEAVVRALREAVAAVDDEVALYDVQPVEHNVAAALASPRFHVSLFAVFAALAVLLAALGIYGVMSYLVSQRTREMGVRSALGAGSRSIVWLIEREALAVTAAGITLGLLASVALTRTLASLLFDVTPLDAVVLILVSVFLALVGIAAASVPAWRASRIDTVHALRGEP